MKEFKMSHSRVVRLIRWIGKTYVLSSTVVMTFVMLMFVADVDAQTVRTWLAGRSALAFQTTRDIDGVPSILNYDGFVTDAQGIPISGNHQITVRIYDGISSITPLWEEFHANVSIENGYFSLFLGELSSLNESLFQSELRYIGIALDSNDEMLPRQRLASVPFAIQSHTASHASFADIAAHANSSDFAESARHSDTTDLAAIAKVLENPTNSLAASDGVPNNSVYVDADGNVGVGSIEPHSKLDVQGDVNSVGQKICQLRLNGNLAVDTLLVSAEWPRVSCAEIGTHIHVRLGCLYQDSISWGGWHNSAANAHIPSINCGW